MSEEDQMQGQSTLMDGSTAETTAKGSASAQPRPPAIEPLAVHLRLSFEGMPEPIPSLLQKLAEPHKESKLKSLVKDYLPALSPIATAVFTAVVAVYGAKFNTQLTRDTLDKITTEFVEGKGANPEIAALKLSAYGDSALPAVRMVLASDDDALRRGGVLIAEEMYIEETVKHNKLMDAMLRNYDNRVMRRGVLEWLKEMNGQLSEDEIELALGKIRGSFGTDGGGCTTQADGVPLAAGDVLLAWSSKSSKKLAEDLEPLALAMARSCENEGAREQAVNALKNTSKMLPKEGRDSMIRDLEALAGTSSPKLIPEIKDAIAKIGQVQGP